MTKKTLSGKDKKEKEVSIPPCWNPLWTSQAILRKRNSTLFFKGRQFISCWSHCIWKYFRMPSSPCPLPDTPHHTGRKQPLLSSPLIPQHSSRNHVPSGSLKYIWISLKSSGNYASASCGLFPFIATFSEIIQLDILERFGMNQTSQIRGKFVSQGSVQVINIHESRASKILTKHIVWGRKCLLSTSALTAKILQVFQNTSFHLHLLKVEWLCVTKPLIGSVAMVSTAVNAMFVVLTTRCKGNPGIQPLLPLLVQTLASDLLQNPIATALRH